MLPLTHCLQKAQATQMQMVSMAIPNTSQATSPSPSKALMTSETTALVTTCGALCTLCTAQSPAAGASARKRLYICTQQ